MNKRLTTISQIPKDLEKKMYCRLLHQQVPVGIDPKTREIIYKCKEGCDNRNGE